MQNKIKVLVLGQTPPPYLGQAMMIGRLVNAHFERVHIYHVRMSFSDELKSIGKFSVKKLFHIPELVVKTIAMRLRHNIKILYYPPAGPHMVPLLRDIMILFFVRPFFSKVIFHHRAAGVSQLLERSRFPVKQLGKLVYNNPSGTVQASILNPADGKYFHAKKIFIIKNGLEDEALKYLPIERPVPERITVLFVGAMYEERGLLIIADAAKILSERGLDFQFKFVGDFATEAFFSVTKQKLADYGLTSRFHFLGSKIKDEKWKEFLRADIFIFPSFVESESFGNVIAEAMMFGLPVIATEWNAIPELVTDQVTGFLVPTRAAGPLAEKILLLAKDANLRAVMGNKGREKFLAEFQLSKHLKNMEDMFVEVSNQKE